MNNIIRLERQHNGIQKILITSDTGAYFKRPFGIFTHVGICLGKNPDTNERVFAHLHNTTRYPCIVNEREFRNGYTGNLSRESKSSPYSPTELINRSLQLINKGDRYNLIGNNCQHFANAIYFGAHRSEEVAYSMVAGFVLLISVGISSD